MTGFGKFIDLNILFLLFELKTFFKTFFERIGNCIEFIALKCFKRTLLSKMPLESLETISKYPCIISNGEGMLIWHGAL